MDLLVGLRNRGPGASGSPMLIHVLHRSHKAVAQAWPRFNESRALRQISEHAAKLVDRRIQVMVEGHIGIRPELFAKRLPPYHLSGALNQRLQNLEGLFF